MIQVWQEQDTRFKTVAEYKAANKSMFAKSDRGVRTFETPDGLRVYLEIPDIDLMVTKDHPGGKGEILHSEEIKTGINDQAKTARTQLDDGHKAITEAASGGKRVKLLESGKDVTDQIDLATIDNKDTTDATRGPADKKGFEASLDITARDLEALIKQLLDSTH